MVGVVRALSPTLGWDQCPPALGQREGAAERTACSPAPWVPSGVWAAGPLGLETGAQATSLTSTVSWAALWLSAFWGGEQVGKN